MRDRTSGDAISAVAAETLIDALERLELRRRVIVFAHIAMGYSVHALAQQFGMTMDEVEQEAEAGVRALRDMEGVRALAGIERLGDLVDFFGHIHRLHLERWFCAYCRKLMVVRPTGRPKTYCGNSCRARAHREGIARRGG